MPIDSESLRLAMRAWSSGVTIVTSHMGDISHGMTVSSFTSISLVPPLLLVSLAQDTRTHALVKKSGVFAVTILSAEQQAVADRFADPLAETLYRFSSVETYTLITGAPLLRGGLAQFDCKVVSAHPMGTHTIFIGEVVAVEHTPLAQPLLYHNRGYHQLGPL